MEDYRLVKKAKKGDKEALLQLIMKRKNQYYRLAFTYVGNEHDAMDALEEMIVLAYEKIHQLQKAESFYSWTNTILVNCCKSLVKKRLKLVFLDETDSKKQPDAITNPYIVREQQLDLQDLLSRLNQHQREAIALKYFHDLDYKSISKITGVSIGTVKSRIFQGLKKMKTLYGADADE
ncbi:sigma-70 family RNA polymerase sigma factor [Halalkalibacter okhensis]|uniref:ECF subfamily RNA polymerase sigma-24 factor n=1 Tax=Halalkalibacter okhensis TaxID=333138 RepID=A0A0B0IHL1_9BACI|nr:sigma-70 family RNA polymerase sigma factor [Halalkalibacter okhensis]KHF39156.1 ECF subfamily RNA polymerase sigma-24 factor [Halalkalibacter okhensis]